MEREDIEELQNKIEEARGKKIIIDIADLPKGLSIEKWMYYFDNMSVCFVDSKKGEFIEL